MKTIKIGGEDYVSVKDYAEERHITVSAVTQSIRREKNSTMLRGHIFRDGNGKTAKMWLDMKAVAILDAARGQNTIAVDAREKKEEYQKKVEELEGQLADRNQFLRTFDEMREDIALIKDSLSSGGREDREECQRLKIEVNELNTIIAQDRQRIALLNEQLKAERAKNERLMNRSFWERIRNKDV